MGARPRVKYFSHIQLPPEDSITSASHKLANSHVAHHSSSPGKTGFSGYYEKVNSIMWAFFIEFQ